MKYISTLILIASFNWACKTNQISEPCIDESKINKMAICTREYRPVCGCDGKTYGNRCEAEANGLLRWTDGACGE